jgi:uncharacterized protein
LFLNTIHPPFEVAIVGNKSGQLRDELMRYYLPNCLILGGNTEGYLPLLEGKLQKGESIYMCVKIRCVSSLLRQLQKL